MSNIFFTPPIEYKKRITSKSFITLSELCRAANISCAASGKWTQRKVDIVYSNKLRIFAEPGDWGAVRIAIARTTRADEARVALIILAYSLQDLVAKQSIKGIAWGKVPLPRGRKRTGKALTNAERQRLFRAKENSTKKKSARFLER